MKKLILITLAVTTLFLKQAFAQPANDDCSGAINLGTLAAPANCGVGLKNGAATNVAGTNVNATPENPYVTLVGCGMASPANSVWYKYTAPAKGYGVQIAITGASFTNPNVALWNGTNCSSLAGVDCNVGAAGAVTLNVASGMVPGQTYYIQVSGNTGQSGTFNMAVYAFQDCADCLNASSITITPLPTNGTYLPGQVVSFCYHVTKYSQVNNNWLHGVQLAFGSGWNLATLTTSPPAPVLDAAGAWAYYSAGITSDASASLWPAGFYFEDINADGNPGNNFGDGIDAADGGGSGYVYTSTASQWNFCWTITVKTGCNPGMSLAVDVNTSGDGESGSYNNPGCASDPTTSFNAIISCCPPIMTSTPSCTGETTGTATATPVGSAGPYDYVWTNSGGTIIQTVTNIAGANTVSNLAPGTYTVSVIDVNSCASSATVVVAANALPVLTITNPVAVCDPSTVNITVAAVTAGSTGAGTLTYWTDAAATIALATPSAVNASGTYYIKSTTAAGCVDINPVVVTINSLPVLTITDPAGVCAPLTVDITAAAVTAGSTGGGTLTYWTNAAATAALASPSAVSVSNTYYIKTTTAAGCVDINPVVVTINPKPVLTITNPAAVCPPLTVNITVAAVTAGSPGAGILSYWNDLAATSSLANPNAISVSNTYYIQSTTAFGCKDIKPVIVTISPLPVLAITNPPAVCTPGTVDITNAAVTAGSTGGGTLTYWTDAGATASLAIPTAVAIDGIYYIQSTTAGGCKDVKPVTVTISPAPVLVITNPSAVCEPNTVDITLPAVTAGTTGAGTLSYWTNAGATIALASPNAVAVGGTYYIKSTVGTCTDIKPVLVTINPKPVLVITDPAAVCSPLTVDITAPAVTAGSTGSGTLTYWTDAIATSSLTSPNAISTSGTYYIQSTTASGCKDVKPVLVTINAIPILVIADPAAVCSPLTVDITDPLVTTGSTGGGALTYWTNAIATIPLVTPNAVSTGGTYYIQATTAAGCKDTKPVLVTINAKPVLVITDPAAVCSTLTVDITAPAVTSGSTGAGTLTYWTDAIATSSLTSPNAISTSGTYYIQSTTAAGCKDIKPVLVTVNTSPVLVITDPAAVCSPLTVDITAPSVTTGSTGAGTFTYWTDNLATTPLASPNAVSTSATYFIQSTTVAGCKDTKPVLVTINTKPVLVITNPAAVCSPLTVDITNAAITSGSTGAGTLSYWTDVAATLSLASPNAVTASGTYYIQAATVAGCTDIETVLVTVNTTPVLVITDPVAVCSPLTVDITAPSVTTGSTGAATFTYWTDNLATNPLASPNAVSTSGTYFIQSTTVAGCKDIKQVTIVVNTTPVLTITNPAAVCSPLTVDITAPAVTAGSTGGGTLTYWTNPAATNPLATPNAISNSASYYIEATTTAGCYDIELVTVIVNTTPVLTIANPGPVCSPLTVDITTAAVTAGSTGGGTLSYWQDINATSALASPNAVITSGTYYIQSATVAGCKDIEPVDVEINELPVLNINNPAAVCFPLTVDITAALITGGSTGGGTLTYWTDNAATIPLASPSAIGSSGVYYIQSTTVAECKDIKPVTVVVNTTPVLTITNPPAVCSPLTVNITASSVIIGNTGGGTLSYWNDLAATSALVAPSAVSTSGTYYIQSSTLAGCKDIEPVNVIINPLPVLTPHNPFPVCQPNTIDITAAAVTAGSAGNGVLSYWTNMNATIPLASPNALSVSGLYYILSTTSAGCKDTTPVTVTVNTKPSLTINTPAAVCAPLTVDISAANITIGSTGGGALTYWMDAAATNPLASPAAVNMGGTYYIEATTIQGCADTNAVVLTINPLPNLNIINPPDTTCSPSTVDISNPAWTISSTGIGTLSYWTDINATIPLSSYTAITTSGTYYIKMTTVPGCFEIKPITITINPLPVAAFGPVSSGCPVLPVDFVDASTGIIVDWLWDFGDGSTFSGPIPPTHYFDNTGLLVPKQYTISLTVTTDKGCIKSKVIPSMITVNPNPKADFIPTPNPVTVLNPSVTLENLSSSDVNYWNYHFGDGDSIKPNTSSPTHLYPKQFPDNYTATLWVENMYTCRDTIEHEVIIGPEFTFFIPNAFSPNNDGINDTFFGSGIGIAKYDLYIFDRWGNLVFYTDVLAKFWDGKANHGSEMAQQDVFVWKVKLTDDFGKKHDYIGTVTIVK